jgi:hypothetical protein
VEKELRSILQFLERNYDTGLMKLLLIAGLVFFVLILWYLGTRFMWRVEKDIFYRGVKPFDKGEDENLP